MASFDWAQSLSDTQKKKKPSMWQTLTNAFCRASLVNTDMDNRLAHLQNAIFQNKFNNFLLFRVMTLKPNGNGIILQHHCL